MKITDVTPFVLRIPVQKPHTEEPVTKELAGVLVQTDSGLTGTGFTGPHSSGGRLLIAPMAVYRELLLGEDPLQVQYLWDRLHRSKLAGIGRAGVVTLAHAAIDIALWDIVAQASVQPLWRLLGGHKPGGVASYVTVGDVDWDAERLIRAAAALLEDGWNALKLKVGGDTPRSDAAKLREVRKSCGYGFRLMADANKRWSLAAAKSFCQHAADLDLTWLEEPCDPEDIQAHADLARSTPIPLAVGESLYTKFEFRAYLDARAATYLQADATHLSGITEWLTVAGLASCHRAAIVPHHSDFAQAQQHLAGGNAAVWMIEFPWATPIFVCPVRRNGDLIALPEVPGATTAILPGAFQEFRIF